MIISDSKNGHSPSIDLLTFFSVVQQILFLSFRGFQQPHWIVVHRIHRPLDYFHCVRKCQGVISALLKRQKHFILLSFEFTQPNKSPNSRNICWNYVVLYGAGFFCFSWGSKINISTNTICNANHHYKTWSNIHVNWKKVALQTCIPYYYFLLVHILHGIHFQIGILRIVNTKSSSQKSNFRATKQKKKTQINGRYKLKKLETGI